LTDPRYVDGDFIDRVADALIRLTEQENPNDEPVTKLAIPKDRFLRAEIQRST